MSNSKEPMECYQIKHNRTYRILNKFAKTDDKGMLYFDFSVVKLAEEIDNLIDGYESHARMEEKLSK